MHYEYWHKLTLQASIQLHGWKLSTINVQIWLNSFLNNTIQRKIRPKDFEKKKLSQTEKCETEKFTLDNSFSWLARKALFSVLLRCRLYQPRCMTPNPTRNMSSSLLRRTKCFTFPTAIATCTGRKWRFQCVNDLLTIQRKL